MPGEFLCSEKRWSKDYANVIQGRVTLHPTMAKYCNIFAIIRCNISHVLLALESWKMYKYKGPWHLPLVTESRWSPACGRFSLGGCCLNLSVKPIFCWRCQSCRKSVRKSCRQGVEPAIKAIWYQLWNYMFGVWAPPIWSYHGPGFPHCSPIFSFEMRMRILCWKYVIRCLIL